MNEDDDLLAQISKVTGSKPPSTATVKPTPYDALFDKYGAEQGVDPDLLRAMTGQESGFNPNARSNKNAQGLMQMIPATASRFGVKNVWDPDDNIRGGAKYIKWLLDRFDGNVDLALAGYNAGEGAVEKYGKQIPPYQETRDYVRKIRGNYKGSGYLQQPANDNILQQVSEITGGRVPETAPSSDGLLDQVSSITNGMQQPVVGGVDMPPPPQMQQSQPVQDPLEGLTATKQRLETERSQLRNELDRAQTVPRRNAVMLKIKSINDSLGKLEQSIRAEAAKPQASTLQPNGVPSSIPRVGQQPQTEPLGGLASEAMPDGLTPVAEAALRKIAPLDGQTAPSGMPSDADILRQKQIEVLGHPIETLGGTTSEPVASVSDIGIPISDGSAKDAKYQEWAKATNNPDTPENRDYYDKEVAPLIAQQDREAQQVNAKQVQGIERPSHKRTVQGAIQETEQGASQPKAETESIYVPVQWNKSKTGAAKTQAMDDAAASLASRVGVDYDVMRRYLDEGGQGWDSPFSVESAERRKQKGEAFQIGLDANAVREVKALQASVNERKERLKQALDNPANADPNPKIAGVNALREIGSIDEAKANAIITEEREAQEEALRSGYGEGLAQTSARWLLSIFGKNMVRAEGFSPEEVANVAKQYGGFAEMKKRAAEIEAKYANRPLARPNEAALNMARYVLKIPSTISSLAGMGIDAMSLADIAVDNPANQFADYWTARIDSAKTEDFKGEILTEMLPEALAQFGVQATLAPLTGGASLALPIAEGATAQYNEARKGGASRETRLFAGLIGGGAAAPEALLHAKYLRNLLPDAQTAFVDKMVQATFGRFSKILGEAEARAATKSFVGNWLKNAATGGAFEGLQEASEDIVNKTVQKLTYKPEITWKDIISPSAQEQKGYLVAGLLGTVGGSVETVLERMSDTELDNSGVIISQALKAGDITQTEAEEFTAGAKTEIASRAKGQRVKPRNIIREVGTDVDPDALTVTAQEIASVREVLDENAESPVKTDAEDLTATRPVAKDETLEPGTTVELEDGSKGVVFEDKGKSVVVDTKPVTGKDGETTYSGRKPFSKNKIKVQGESQPTNDIKTTKNDVQTQSASVEPESLVSDQLPEGEVAKGVKQTQTKAAQVKPQPRGSIIAKGATLEPKVNQESGKVTLTPKNKPSIEKKRPIADIRREITDALVELREMPREEAETYGEAQLNQQGFRAFHKDLMEQLELSRNTPAPKPSIKEIADASPNIIIAKPNTSEPKTLSSTEKKRVAEIDKELRGLGGAMTNVSDAGGSVGEIVQQMKALREEKEIVQGTRQPASQAGEFSDSLGISRSEMPQIAGDDQKTFTSFAQKKGVDIKPDSIVVSELKPSQKEYNPAQAAQIPADKLHSKPLMVSSDNRILDGHSTLVRLQQSDPAQKIDILRIPLPAKEALELMRSFPKVTFKSVKSVGKSVGDALTHNGITVPVKPLPLTGEKAEIQDKTLRSVFGDPQKHLDAYDSHPGTKGGREINADMAKELFDEYGFDPLARVSAVHKASSAIAELAFQTKLRSLPKGSNVAFMAGGGGSGKGYALKNTVGDQADAFSLIYDGTMKDGSDNIRLLKATIEAGHVPYVFAVLAPADVAAIQNVKRSINSLRLVPSGPLVDAHEGFRKTFVGDTQEFAAENNIPIAYLYNDGQSEPREVSLEEFRDLVYAESGDIKKIIDEATYDEISRKQHKGSNYDERLRDAYDGKEVVAIDVRAERASRKSGGEIAAGSQESDRGRKPQTSRLTTEAEIEDAALDIISELYDEVPVRHNSKNKQIGDALEGLAAIFGDDITMKSALSTSAKFDEEKYAASKALFDKIADAVDGLSGDVNADLRSIITTLKNEHKLAKEGVVKLVPYLSRYLSDKIKPLQSDAIQSIGKKDDTDQSKDTRSDRPVSGSEPMPNDDGRSDTDMDGRQLGDVDGTRPERSTVAADQESNAESGQRAGSKGGVVKPASSELRDPTDRGATPARSNFRITNELDFERFSPKLRFRKNVEAIRLLNTLDEEGRSATAEEQSVLVQYVGWGGLKQAFDSKNDKWANEFKELKALLPDGEYEKARRSILNSHYTSKTVVDGIWKAVERLGFKRGAVLEPSMGTGNFFGLMPTSLQSDTTLTGVEFEPFTSRIAKHLYPNSELHAPKGFQEVYLAPNSIDLAIGNPPFGDETLYDKSSKELSKLKIHAYFFAKSVESLRPGGILAMVVSKGFLDSRDAQARSARKFVGDRAELIGAIRLPNNAFGANANTEVTTDVIFLQKKGEGVADHSGVNWYDVGTVKDKESGEDIPVNKYFVEHPDMMLGNMTLTGSMYRANEPTLEPTENQDLGVDITNAIDKLPKDIFTNSTDAITERLVAAEVKESSDYTGLRPYNFGIAKNGKIFQMVVDQNGQRSERPIAVSEANLDRVGWMISIRQIIRELLSMESNPEITDKQLKSVRDTLNVRYDTFFKKYGYVSSDTNKRIFRDDADYPLLQALEKNYDRGITKEAAAREGIEARKPSASKADIFTQRTVSPVRPVTSAANADDALIASLNNRGRMDLDYMSGLYKKSADEIINELGAKVFEDPEKGWVTSDEYLSGDVKTKLDEANKAALEDRRFVRNVEALEKVIPADVPPTDIFIKLGSPWVPKEAYEQFVNETIDGRFSGTYHKGLGRWVGLNVVSQNAVLNTDKWGTKAVPAARILMSLFANKQPQVKKPKLDENGRSVVSENGTPVMVVDPEETAAAQGKADSLLEEFGDWVWRDADRRQQLAALYNETFNRRVTRKFVGEHLQLPGLSSSMQLRPHIRNFIYRTLQSGKAMADHVVGAGKAQPLDAKILTPTGWKLMGEIRTGDYVIGRDGKPTKVLAVFPQGEKDIFEVQFSDGSKTECCDEHLWKTQTYSERGYAQRAEKAGKVWPCGDGGVRSLSEIRDTLRSDHLKAINHSIPMVEAVQFRHQETIVDPYLMGVLLGDGTFRDRAIRISLEDDEIIERCASVLPSGHTFSLHEHSDRTRRWGIKADGKTNLIKNEIRSVGLDGADSSTKFIPEKYKINSIDTRIAILQGLMDTDGYVSKKGTSVYFCTISDRLADDMTFIVQSLGGMVSQTAKRPKYTYNGEKRNGQLAHVLCLSLPADINPFRLSRKNELVVPKSSYAPTRYIKNVVAVGSKQAQCIAVENPEKLYVTDDFIVTHNTPTAIATAMEMRRLGMSKKPMFTVPNHLVEQWAMEFKKFYPGANVLAATKKDFEKKRRQELFAKIATGDWDAVIVAHSSFQFIPVPVEVEQTFIQEQIAEIQSAIDATREADGKKARGVRDMEKALQALEDKFKRLSDVKRDDLLNFQELGVDSLFVDEAHEYKNLFFTTQKQGVGSLGQPQGSQKAFDMFMKTQMILQKNNNRNLIFLTGTPVSNSLAEIFHMQRYLQREDLKRLGIANFDAWAAAKALARKQSEFDIAKKDKGAVFGKTAELEQMKERQAELLNELRSAYSKKPTVAEPDPEGSLKSALDIRSDAFYSQVERTIIDKMPNKASAQQIKGILSPSNGVKAAELEWLDIDAFLADKKSVTKDELLDYVRANNVQVEGVVKGGDAAMTPEERESVLRRDGDLYASLRDSIITDAEYQDESLTDDEVDERVDAEIVQIAGDDQRWMDAYDPDGIGVANADSVKFSQFTLPGGENYRELLLTMPPKPRKLFEVVEKQGRTAQGATYPVFRVRQIATGELLPTAFRARDEAEAQADQQNNNKANQAYLNSDVFKSSHFDEPNILAHVRFDERDGGTTLHIAEIQSDFGQALRAGKDVPKFPFPKSWHELAIKRMLRYASENGYERITWDTGETQNDRYDLSKQVDSIKWRKVSADSYRIEVIKDGKGIDTGLPEVISSDKLADAIGKDQAEKITTSEESNGTLEGNDLKISGAGMTGFYDKMLPSFVNKYTKKWGGKVESGTIRLLTDWKTEKDTGVKYKDTTVHSLTITPAMRDAVLLGQPLFSKLDPTADELANEAMTVEEMKDLPFADWSDIIVGSSAVRRGDTVKLNPQSHEIYRRILEEYKIRHRQIVRGSTDYEDLYKAQFIPPTVAADMASILREKAAEAPLLGYRNAEVAVLVDHASMLEKAMLEGNGTAILYVFKSALPEERFHQADFLGAADKTIFNRHSERTKPLLDNHRIASILWAKHFSKFNEYRRMKSPLLKAVLRAEIAPYLLKSTEAELAAMGITPEMRDDYLNTWFEGYVEKNGIEAVEFFNKDELDVKRFTEAAVRSYSESATGEKGRSNDQLHEGTGEKLRPDRDEGRTTQSDTSGDRGNPKSEGLSREDFTASTNEVELGPGEKLRSLPKTMRRAGIDAIDLAYEVFSDARAVEEATRLLEENGIEGSIALLRNLKAEAQDAEHAVLSFMLQRTLQDNAYQLRDTDPDTAQKHFDLSLTLGREHAIKATQAGRYTRMPSVIGKTTEGFLYSIQGVIEDTYGPDKSLSAAEWQKWQDIGKEVEELHAKFAQVTKENRNQRAKIKRLQDKIDGTTPKRRQNLTARRKLVTLIKTDVAPDIDAIRVRLKNRFNSASVGSASPDIALKSAIKPDDFPIDDFAQVGAMHLLENLAENWEYLPSQFRSEMIAEFGDAIEPYLEDIYKKSWELREQWMIKARKDKRNDRISKEVGRDLEDWEVDEILGERREASAKRRAIEKYHQAEAKGIRRSKNFDAYISIIADLANSPNVALGAAMFAENLTPAQMADRLTRQGITTKQSEYAEIIRQGKDIFEKAKQEHQADVDAAANEILNEKAAQKEIDDLRWQIRRDMQNVQNRVSDELRRIKSGKISYRLGQIVDASNAFRTMMASFDLSAALRQGGFFAFAKPEAQAKAFGNMFKSIREKGYGRAIIDLENNPNFILAQRSGIDFAMAGRSEQEQSLMGEELFRGEQFIEKIPLAGYLLAEGIVKPSERTYTAFLDTQRMVMFDLLAKEISSTGATFQTHPQEFKALAKFINIATGRGTMPRGRVGKLILDLPLFAPRYTLSRLQLLNTTLNPVAYYNLPPTTRKVVAKSAVRFYGTVGLIIGFASALGLVSWDDDDGDFLKIKVGNTRYDLFAGLLQPARTILRLVHAGVRGNRVPGELSDSILSNLGRFARGKLSPGASLGLDALMGSDYVGQEFAWLPGAFTGGDPKELGGIVKRLIPLTLSELSESYQLDGTYGPLKTLPFAIFGIGASTYKAWPERATTEAEKLASKALSMRLNSTPQTSEERKQRMYVAELTARARNGEHVAEELEQALKDKKISYGDRRKITDALQMTYLEDKAERLSLEEIEAVFRVATKDEQELLLPIVGKKMKNADVGNSFEPGQRERLEKIGASVLGDYPMPKAVEVEFERYNIKKPDVGETISPRKGQKVPLDNAEYERYRRSTLKNVYEEVDELIATPKYQQADPATQKSMIEKKMKKARSAPLKEMKKEIKSYTVPIENDR